MQATIATRGRVFNRALLRLGRRRSIALGVVLVVACVVRLWLVARDVPTLNSDEAVVGLMALHLLRGEWTAFYWGQSYMGSLEAILAAPFVALLGTSLLALRLTLLALTLGFLATIFALGSRIYTARVGLASAALLAVGPPFFAVMSLRALGGYMETLLLGNLLLLLALAGAAPRMRTRQVSLLGGLLVGLAIWTDMLVLPFVLVAALLCWWQRRSDLLPWRRNGVALVAGAAVGAAPALVANVLDGGGTILAVLGFTSVGGSGPALSPGLLLGHLWLIATVTLPILAGSFFGGTQVTGYLPNEYYSAASAHPLAYGMSLVLAAAVVLLLANAAVRSVRGWRALHVAEGASLDEGLVHAQGEAALVLVGVAYLVAFTLNKELYIFSSPRYLLPLYSVVPVVVAEAARLAGAVRAHWSVLRGRVARGLVVVAFVLALIWCGFGTATLTPQATAARDHGIPVSGRDTYLLAVLRAHQVHTVISNDYWEGMRLTYESGESIITVMITTGGYIGFNRYPPYIVRGLADPQPAYVQLAGTRDATLALDKLHAGLLPGYTEYDADGFIVLVPAR